MPSVSINWGFKIQSFM